MGVKDLVDWIKKNHPTAILSFPKRWAAPEIKGKRIAIDATLLTNRYHFAITNGPLKGKGALVGWYKRLHTRLLASARRQHEDLRQERLEDLREGLQALRALPEAEQEAVKHAWSREPSAVESIPTPSAIPPSSPSAPSVPSSREPAGVVDESTEELDTSETEESIERISTMEDTLRGLVDRYRASLTPPPTRIPLPDAIDDVVEDLTELEKLSELLDLGIQRVRLGDTDASREFVDDRAGDLLPAEGFRETKRQNELTVEEGRIIEESLRPRGVAGDLFGLQFPIAEVSEVDSTSPATPAETQEPSLPLISDDPLDRLDELIEAAPVVRDVYERALFQPTAETHRDCRDLLQRLNVPILWAEAPYEAEGLATSLALAGVVDWVGSEDSDVIALGGPLLKNISSATSPLIALPADPLLSLASLTRSQFTDFCILLGNDACPRIPQVGPVTAYKYILKHGSIEAIIENEEKVRDKIIDLEEYMEMVGVARGVFGTLPQISDEGKRELDVSFGGMKGQDVDLEGVERWLEERHGIRFVSPGEDEGGAIE